MDPIDISSESSVSVDSAFLFDENDLESDASTERESTNPRNLPVAPDSRDTARGSQAGIASSSTAFASNGSTSKENDHSFVRQHNEPSTSEGIRASNQPAVQQAFKRTLPPSFNRSSPNSRSPNLDETASSIRARDINPDTDLPAGTSATHSKGHTKDYHGRGDYEDAMMYGKSNSSPPFGSSDPFDRPMATEDERLIYQAALEDLNQPKIETDPPDGLLSVSLLRHQKIALTWMLQKEMRSLHCLGGILADDQGLGKTISMIALIQMQKYYQSKAKSEDQSSHKPEALNLDDDDENGCSGLTEVKQPGESDGIKPISKVSASSRAFRRNRPAAGTLVVCPASVLRQWARELQEKVPKRAKLTFLLYHGGARTRDPVELAKYDVVLTTYAIVTNEVPKQPIVDEDEVDDNNEEMYNKRKKKTASFIKRKKKGLDDSSGDYDSGPLAWVAWLRVVLDEAQTIKNHRTQVARACCSLRAKRRWCLSGTPIQNAIDDLYSYFRFLRYDPYAVYRSFYNTIKLPISQSSSHGYKKLQVVLRAIMLRRTKGTLIDGEPIVKLPPKSIRLKKVDFSTEERAFYTRLEADSRSKFKAYAAAGTVSQNYANILLMLLRLRQACDHPLLVKGSTSDTYGKESAEMVKALPDEMVVNLLNSLATSSAICQVCNDPPEDPIVTMCNHVFCYQCVYDYLTSEDNTCPAPGCKEQLDHDIVFSEATLRSRMSGNLSASVEQFDSDVRSIVLHNEYSSSKIRAVLEILQSDSQSKHSSPPVKTMIFSQWTGMLDLVQASLEQYQIEYRRLDGTMTLTARDKAVKDFNCRDEVTVMIMSLKAGNLGLNMVAASRVILLDLWWNPTTEDQAIDRAHRIGQTRPVSVTRLTIKDTVEDRILALQEEKRRMVASAFGEDPSGGAATRLTAQDLKYLFMGSRGPRA